MEILLNRIVQLRQPITFMAIGFLNSLIDYTIFMALVYFGTSPILANVISFSCGAINSYFMNKSITFRSAHHSAYLSQALIRFFAVACITLGISQIALGLSISHGSGPALGKFISIVCTLIIGFTLNKFVVFTARPDDKLTPKQITWIAAILVSLIYAIVLISTIWNLPLQLWDESRLAINVLEMYYGGLSFITTYELSPDLWNTKPPLLIWLAVISMKIFGISIWAFRAPSLAASCATIAITFVFSKKISGSYVTSIFSVILLSFSHGFFSEHAAFTGDYDSILTLFTTSYLYLLFMMIHRREPTWIQCLLFSFLLACAVLTKGIAGFIPGVGIPIYLILSRRGARVLGSFRYWMAGGGTISVILGFYGLREILAPGYIRAVLHNEVGGRFAGSVGHNQGVFWYYLRRFRASFSIGPLLYFASLLVFLSRSRLRAGFIYTFILSISFITVISLASTKLPWYDLPVYPLLSCMCAFALQAATGNMDRLAIVARSKSVTIAQLVQIVIVASLIAGIVVRALPIRFLRHDMGAYYGDFFAKIYGQGGREISILHKGVYNTEGLTGYDPQFEFFQMLWRNKGLDIHDIGESIPSRKLSGIIGTCDSRFVSYLRQNGTVFTEYSGCIAVYGVRLKS